MFLILIVFNIFAVSFSERIPCNRQSIEKLDNHIMSLSLLGHPNRNYPQTDKDVLANCQDNGEMLNWMRNYTKTCLVTKDVETSRHVTNLMAFSIQKVNKRRCRTETTRKLYINYGKCGNTAKTDTIKCFNQYSYQAEQINRSKGTRIENQNHLIPLLCCVYHKFEDCLSNVYSNQKYRHVCTPKYATELEADTHDSTYDVLQYLCGDYQENNDKCERLLVKYKDVFNSVKLNFVPISPMSASNEVFDSIPPL